MAQQLVQIAEQDFLKDEMRKRCDASTRSLIGRADRTSRSSSPPQGTEVTASEMKKRVISAKLEVAITEPKQRRQHVEESMDELLHKDKKIRVNSEV